MKVVPASSGNGSRASGRFNFTVRGPDAPGDYPQYFGLVREGVSWFAQSGGPADNVIQIRVTSTAPPPCPEGIDGTWSCEGSDRVRCERGMVFRETCEHGCAGEPAECAGPVVDDDGDGSTTDDCDPADASIHPGATEVCDDGIDQDCDGLDPVCDGGDGGTVVGPRRDAGPGGPGGDAELVGGCSVAHGTHAGRLGAIPFLFAAICAGLVRRRRR